ncbi:DHH family phosphoesterase [bacterium]|nr:DHH family phosphoesterase [bacterium]
MEIKNLRKTAQRIKQAVKNKEKIVLYSDSDLDGVTSLLILEESIKSLGGDIVAKYFYNRGKEGCGLNEDSLKFLEKYAPSLLILTDCGIANFKQIDSANKLGFEVIVIDHHEILGEVPNASIVVDPKQKGEKYPFKDFAACGLAFRLSELIFGKSFSESLKQEFLELAALGTIADMMPKVSDNKEIIDKGLKSLYFTIRPGLSIMVKILGEKYLSFKELVAKITYLLQMTEVKKHIPESYLLLSSKDEKTAKKYFDSIYKKYFRRQDEIADLTDQIIEEAGKNRQDIIFYGSAKIPALLTGVLASRAYKKFEKPTIIYHINKKISRGSIRVGQNIDSVSALKKCSLLLEEYGGHPPASGFSAKNKNLEKFKECLKKYFSRAKK